MLSSLRGGGGGGGGVSCLVYSRDIPTLLCGGLVITTSLGKQFNHH